MVTVNSLNEWFNNLKEKEQLIALSMFCGFSLEEANNSSNSELIEMLFVGHENQYKELIVKDWNNLSNLDKLDAYWCYNNKQTTTCLDLLDINDSDNYVLFLERKQFVSVLNLDKPYNIYTTEHLMKLWNELSEKEKAERLLNF